MEDHWLPTVLLLVVSGWVGSMFLDLRSVRLGWAGSLSWWVGLGRVSDRGQLCKKSAKTENSEMSTGQKWPGTRIRIFGLIRIRTSAGSRRKCFVFVTLSASVIISPSFVWETLKNLVRNGKRNGKVIKKPHLAPDQDQKLITSRGSPLAGPTRFSRRPLPRSWVILLTERQTDKETDRQTDNNSANLGGVIKLEECGKCKCKSVYIGSGKYVANINPLIAKLNRRATDHYIAIQWLVHWPLMGALLHLVQWGGDWAGRSPLRPLITVPNVTASPPINGQCTNFVLFDVAL